MAKNLAERLEALSGYRLLYQSTDPRAQLNPVNFSYVTSRIGGHTYYVLSRIADAGLDYTQRTNKLAHHIAVEARDLVAAGPAWVLSQAGLLETEWSGEPHILPEGRKLPEGELKPAICVAWDAITGDAGWAGVLAETITSGKRREAYIIYEPQTQLLPLMVEAQALLPPDRRWEATFSTYYTNLPPGTDCRWRCVVKGTREASHAYKTPETVVINLASSSDVLPVGPLVELARKGGEAQTVAVQRRDPAPLRVTNSVPSVTAVEPLKPTEASPPPLSVGSKSTSTMPVRPTPPPSTRDPFRFSRKRRAVQTTRARWLLAIAAA